MRGAARPALQQLPHHGAVFADACGAQVRRNHHNGEHGVHHRDGHWPAGRHRADPNATAPWPKRCDSTATPRPRLASGTRRQRGKPASPDRSIAGRRTRVSTSSTGFLAARQPVGAVPVRRHGRGRTAQRSELPLHDRHDRQGVAWIKYQKRSRRRSRRSSTSRRALPMPAHVPKEWIARWKGKLTRAGQDVRIPCAADQAGVVAGTRLAPKPPEIRDWTSSRPTRSGCSRTG